jgi:MraZ protein
MFLGEYKHLLDQKGRLAIPAKFRPKLAAGLVITRGIDQCLFVYSREEWEKFINKLMNLPLTQANSRAFLRLIFSGAIEEDLDQQGRILIPENLRNYASLKKQVVIVGVFNRIEIWDEKIWEEYKANTENEAYKISEELKDLGI